MKNYKIIISAGGTGGHIYPAIAIANEFTKRALALKILFVGASGKMEMEKVPQQGYQIIGLPIAGLQRKFSLKNILLPFKILISLFISYRILSKEKPDFVIGTGGYASFPITYIATLKKIPCFIQEQNSYPGVANKMLSKRVTKIFVAYPNMDRFFDKDKIVYTGNPIRKELTEKNNIDKISVFKKYRLSAEKKTLLVMGGSLGAKAINQLIVSKLDFFKKHNIQVLWQCGKIYYDTNKHYNEQGQVSVLEFIKDMHLAYSAADVIISRSGASAVSELAVVGKPVLFIPSVNVAEDHQTKNAKILVDKGAAEMIKEIEIEKFEETFLSLLDETKAQQMKINLLQMSKPQATKDIVNCIIKCIS